MRSLLLGQLAIPVALTGWMVLRPALSAVDPRRRWFGGRGGAPDPAARSDVAVAGSDAHNDRADL
jgi:hypothetical protein